VNKLTLLFFLLIGNLSAISQSDEVNYLFQSDSGKVVFTSNAPLELIQAESKQLRGIVDPGNKTFAFQLKTRSLKGFNSFLQQEHFYENYIETEKYPTASFSGRIIEQIDFSIPGEHTIRAKGILDIHGIKKERIIKCSITIQENGLFAQSEFRVNLDEHNITVPKIVYQKIAEEVMVEIEIELHKQISQSE